ncbi:PAS domain S-box/diguanylate cyclase (GGDEF) domain-containing protein [Thioflavicoccus mobilis 8321]|uniref:cyclic-guanylate-specific phosphodiesterase n=1 Tax=Thioflavicoccus mobilis 8321 TaxID=765912 RepID=L0GWU8_9GAMM|nr:EAL domain-containing protein [Thioflavicoccus mobilis]AGA89779.1 PAS domain S-box/diguanylate cyclase (GGDEF) domain-containing protein [Thioflavicoccus mobilis 8321]
MRQPPVDYRQIVALSLDAILILDHRGAIRYANAAAADLFGRPREQLLGQEFGFVVTPAEPTEIQISHAGGQVISADLRSVDMEMRGEPVTVVYLRNVTERKQAESRLRLFAAAFGNTSEGIMVTDTGPVIITVNEAITEITGFRTDELLGRNPSVLKSGYHGRSFYREMWQQLLGQGHWRGEIWNRCKDGQIAPQWLNINAVRNDVGQVTHYVGVFSDISDIKRSEAQIERLAHRDPLTNLPNRLLFRTLFEQALSRAQTNNSQVGMLLVDLDAFRHINDSLGHGIGDQVLCEVASRLTALVRPEETVARLSGDEFAVQIESDSAIEARASLMAERIIDALGQPLTLGGERIFISASIGIATYPADGSDVTRLMQNSDAALYQARECGGNGYRHYASALSDYARERIVLIADLHRALAEDELVLHYQPQIDMRRGCVIGLEALVRWRHPQRGLLGPDQFIHIAEETGLIIPLGEWVLRHACRQALIWQAAGLPFGRIAVNVSGAQIQRRNPVETVAAILAETGLAADRLELEVTETVVMDLRQEAPAFLAGLKRLGIALAMDDFGTGYSSLAYLKGLPFDTLKIDKGFISGLPEDEASAAIVDAITALAGRLGFKVLAEGVETEAQRRFLLGVGCDLAQGFLFGHPAPAEETTTLLRQPATPPRPEDQGHLGP